MSTITIDIGADFSRVPAGRYKKDGPFSAEALRDDVIEPALAQADEVVIKLDGPHGYGASFIEEVFGGLVRKHGLEIGKRLKIDTKDRPYLIKTIEQFMREAAERQS